jgi:hypothetical protein
MPADVFPAVGSAAVCYAIAFAFCCIGRCFAFALGFGFGRACDLLLAHAQLPWLRSLDVLYSAVCSKVALRVRVRRCLRSAFSRPSTPHHIHSSHTTPRDIHTPHTPHTTHTTITPHTTRHSFLRICHTPHPHHTTSNHHTQPSPSISLHYHSFLSTQVWDGVQFTVCLGCTLCLLIKFDLFD